MEKGDRLREAIALLSMGTENLGQAVALIETYLAGDDSPPDGGGVSGGAPESGLPGPWRTGRIEGEFPWAFHFIGPPRI